MKPGLNPCFVWYITKEPMKQGYVKHRQSYVCPLLSKLFQKLWESKRSGSGVIWISKQLSNKSVSRGFAFFPFLNFLVQFLLTILDWVELKYLPVQ